MSLRGKKVDLHVHSTASDGTCTPSGILDMASGLGLAAVALTDHDTVSGLPEFLGHAARIGTVAAVPGVELSVEARSNTIHILGLFIDSTLPSLCTMLAEVRSNRDKRNMNIIAKLQGMGYGITLAEVEKIAQGESVGRPHFARILVEKGYFPTPQDVFDKCLKRDGPGYCDRVLPTPELAIGEIHKAGGLAFWAHPVHSRASRSGTDVRRIVRELIDYGLDGIEAYYSTFSHDQQVMLQDVAKEYGLLETGGSDFHGDNMKDIMLGSGYGGLFVPSMVYERLKEYHEGQNG